jgi:hypothetical protein
MRAGIYALIENRPGHVLHGLPRYIGQSCNIRRRINIHNTKRSGRVNQHLVNIIEAHLLLQIPLQWKTLLQCSENDLNRHEIQLIALYKDSLVNISSGGRRGDCIVGGRIAGRLSGRKVCALKLGIYAASPEDRAKFSSLGGQVSGRYTHKAKKGIHNDRYASIEWKRENGKITGNRNAEMKLGIHGMKSEDRIAVSKNSGIASKLNKTGLFALPKAKLSELGKRNAHNLDSIAAIAALRGKSRQEWNEMITKAGLESDCHPTRTESELHSLRFYWGKVCVRHPELQGKRRMTNRGCAFCS